MAASLGHPARMAGNGFCRRSRPPASAAKRSRGIAGNGAFWDHYPCVAAVERAVHSTLTLPAVSQASTQLLAEQLAQPHSSVQFACVLPAPRAFRKPTSHACALSRHSMQVTHEPTCS